MLIFEFFHLRGSNNHMHVMGPVETGSLSRVRETFSRQRFRS